MALTDCFIDNDIKTGLSAEEFKKRIAKSMLDYLEHNGAMTKRQACNALSALIDEGYLNGRIDENAYLSPSKNERFEELGIKHITVRDAVSNIYSVPYARVKSRIIGQNKAAQVDRMHIFYLTEEGLRGFIESRTEESNGFYVFQEVKHIN